MKETENHESPYKDTIFVGIAVISVLYLWAGLTIFQLHHISIVSKIVMVLFWPVKIFIGFIVGLLFLKFLRWSYEKLERIVPFVEKGLDYISRTFKIL